MKTSYSLFHINTSFSSIEKKNLKKVIERCYWPLLNLVEKGGFKFSIEASGKSLNDIYSLDPQWISKLKKLIKTKKCEFIGSGFAQIIGPGVPYDINYKNLLYGNEIYKKLLSYTPKIALINEQAFSNSLIGIYKKFYKAIIIDHLNHPNFESDTQEPQILIDEKGNSIPVIWSNSISFQRFQRYIFGDINYGDYLDYLQNYKKKFFCLYSSDVEIFDYRPKGKKSERPLYNDEWKKISNLLRIFKNNKNHQFFFFINLLKKINYKKKINLTSIISPTIVKKQKKYNINRWLLAGQNNLELNTLCHRAFNSIKSKKNSKKNYLKLCELWGSDFRTFPTKKKVSNFYHEIDKLINSSELKNKNFLFFTKKKYSKKNIINLSENENYLYYQNSRCSLTLNKKKGLTIDSFVSNSTSKEKLFGAIKQGFFNNSVFESDFFTSHYTLLNKKNLKRFSGLEENKVNYFSKKNFLIFRVLHKIDNKAQCDKEIILNKDKPELIVNYRFKNLISSYLRLNFITFNPENFDKKKIFIESHLGGKKPERFYLKDKNFNHGSFVENVGSLVTTNNSISATNGKIIVGDNKKEIHFTINQNLSCLVPMIEYEKKKNSYLLRLFFSAKESDETNSEVFFKNLDASIKINIKNKL